MTTTTIPSAAGAAYASDPGDCMAVLSDTAPGDAVPAAFARLSNFSADIDPEAMILSGDDGGTPYWFPENEFLVTMWTGEYPGEGNAYEVLIGGQANDVMHGREGADLQFGLDGDDILQDVHGNNLLDGGAGDDLIEGAGQSLYIGGTGDDNITAWGADFTIAFNAGDGRDSVTLCVRGAAAISLGGAIHAPDLFLARSGSDLMLMTSATDGMAFAGWYDNPAPAGFRLQVLADAGGAGDLTGLYDLLQVISTFDAKCEADPATGAWHVAAQLDQARLEPGDSPLGGALAQVYASDGAIGITGSNASLWYDAFGHTESLGMLL
ncbi:hypothetical protein LXA47_30065 [Massilia sp. P8910]|uniref:calcium-binding protein n=1 Tax=Massilia antarctica TaxID=2765360 RepID=UPI001E4605EA|nr:hypothetical protein [Massilia antarctica]MCE3607815.1 hypothetical protein [Massilia antarctica]